MTGILVATHGMLGKAMLEAVELIAGEQHNVKTLGLCHGDSIEEFEKKAMEYLLELDQGNGVLAFVDFYGGSPCNVIMRCMQKKKILCLAGVNMPMLLEALTNREGIELEQLQNNCLKEGVDSFIKIDEIVKKFMEQK